LFENLRALIGPRHVNERRRRHCRRRRCIVVAPLFKIDINIDESLDGYSGNFTLASLQISQISAAAADRSTERYAFIVVPKNRFTLVDPPRRSLN
jgi:hypothetical protein